MLLLPNQYLMQNIDFKNQRHVSTSVAKPYDKIKMWSLWPFWKCHVINSGDTESPDSRKNMSDFINSVAACGIALMLILRI